MQFFTPHTVEPTAEIVIYPPLFGGRFCAGLVRHPHSGLWQGWYTLNSPQIAWVSARDSQESAASDVQFLRASMRTGEALDPQVFERMLTNLRARGSEPQPVSYATLTAILGQVEAARGARQLS